MEQQHDLFDEDLHCELCNRTLPANSKSTVCAFCAEQLLFSEVKDYIRENDVTEYDVAQHFDIQAQALQFLDEHFEGFGHHGHFDIPIQQVKRWIREGRIEYKSKELSTIKMHCVICGAPVAFGTVCSKCLRQQNTSGHSKTLELDPSRMRYLDDMK